MEIKGKIIFIGDTEEVGNNNFKKRQVVVETEEQYPQKLSIEFVKDKCDVLDNYAEGENVEVSINLRGREWTNPEGEVRYFNSIQGWRIKKLETAQQAEPASEESDDLPF